MLKNITKQEKYFVTVKKANTIHYFNDYCHSDFPFCHGSRER